MLPMADEGAIASIHAELRYWSELGRLLADRRFHAPGRTDGRPPVLLIPGFMAGGPALAAPAPPVLAGGLPRRGHRVRSSGITMNVDCAGRALERLDEMAQAFDEPVVVIGQSRGGTIARALAARRPDAVAAVVTLGSPVLDPLAVSPSVLR